MYHSNGYIPDRPNRPLVVKCGYDGTTRKVTFPSASTCKYESLRARVEECFFLSVSSFVLTYLDDDGEEFSIRSEQDLTEAIAYFISGDDEGNVSVHSGLSANRMGIAGPSTQKISMRVEVILEYDGPSLSDTSSIMSSRTGSLDDHGSYAGTGESSYRSSGYSESMRSGRTGRSSFEAGGSRHSGILGGSYGGSTSELSNAVETMTLSSSPDEMSSRHLGRTASQRSSRRDQHALGRASSLRSSANTAVPKVTYALTGPESDPAPSLLTNSELGSRWLREQSKLATTRRMVYPRSGSSRRYDSDDESLGSDEESSGDLALVRDARGKFYYSYQNADDISLSSTVDYDDVSGTSYRSSLVVPSGGVASRPTTPQADAHGFRTPRAAEESSAPLLAPDCSACGIRLDYMRYVCQTCGEGEMCKENAPDKAPFVPRHAISDSSVSDTSEDTELAGGSSNESQTVYGLESSRVRSSSMSTNASRGSGSRSDHGISPLSSMEVLQESVHKPQKRRSLPRGYELCAGCIESHGIAHSKAAAREAKAVRNGSEIPRRQRAGELRHTFREKIWGPEGWQDVEYAEDTRCTICKSRLYSNCYKCVSCAKFDLCTVCYQKVEEIHPAHVFLSIPDKELPPAERDLSSSTRSNAIRHPGAFCHNCLQDIVGPRFHCAVCPSWDLCIQCEGVSGVGAGSGHTPDHIMMKIPLPLATNEVEAVSRRARDRWFQQDSNAVAAAATNHHNRAPSSRSSSPTNDTVYAGGIPRDAHTPVPAMTRPIITNRDALDHGVRCNNCNEWIMGRRYQCANCPSDPQAYNLCSICELRSYRVHDPRHVFFKLDRPVHIPLKSMRAFLPILYRSRVGEVPSGTTINPRDPVAYLKSVLHRETLCDIHSDQIRGIWLRCAHCAAGFDICQEAEQIANHDPAHVFVVFKARVDMVVFRQVADLAATHSKPLLHEQVYVN